MVAFPDIGSPGVSIHSAEVPLAAEDARRCQELSIRLPGQLEKAHSKRQAEFLAGRYCALTALRRAGNLSKDLEIGVNDDRGPLWPAGWVGSISHTRGFVAAAVARTELRRGVGLDAEPVMDGQRAAMVREKIITDDEYGQHAGLRSALGETAYVTLVFSAKESLYKCLRPHNGKFFGFHEARIEGIDPDSGVFQAVLTASIGGGFEAGWTTGGRFALKDGFIYTFVGF